jgi:hypothetical protein
VSVFRGKRGAVARHDAAIWIDQYETLAGQSRAQRIKYTASDIETIFCSLLLVHGRTSLGNDCRSVTID